MKNLIFLGMLLALFLISCNKKSNVQQKENVLEMKQDSSFSVQGKLVIGHEVCSFTACGDTTDYWLVDNSDRLDSLYEQVVGENAQPYTEVYAELKVKNRGKSTDGFSADYAGVYEVMEIIKVESIDGL